MKLKILVVDPIQSLRGILRQIIITMGSTLQPIL